MRAVIQRVTHASVTIEGSVKSQIGPGYLILLGICDEDTMEDVDWLVKKIANLRVFGDENDVMNRSILDVNGEALVVSQFTLYAITARPLWSASSRSTPATRKAIVRAGSEPVRTSILSHSTRPSVLSFRRLSASP